MNKYLIIIALFLASLPAMSQDTLTADAQVYKKRVLETVEIDFLSSYYAQNGDNAAVTGGIGDESLTDAVATFVVSIPMNDDDVLTIDASVSAYTSASSSNINPFDGSGVADPFTASSGASASDVWTNLTGSYTHSSDDRNDVWSAKLSVSTEYDYFSLGFGGSYTKLFNEKNTEVSVNANIFLDTWTTIYPIELRPFETGGNGLSDATFRGRTITGNPNYNPDFPMLDGVGRNSYAIGFGFSQILHKNVQGSLALDLVQQQGLLSTPFQRVYFADVADSFIDNFQLADDIERLPDNRFKVAIGGRLNWYINEFLTVRTFYRFYTDDWGIKSNTASIELPIKVTDKFTVYPSYRYYDQTAATYFRPYETALSTEAFYTSDYDLSGYNASQLGLGISYTDIFAKAHLFNYGIKSVDLKFHNYNRNTTFNFNIVSLGIKFVQD
ncbi:MAG: DUF3570 domain-containing protein [Nonlabens sp.]|nr:DUF3570 domain-containing protein [Nonlabens sp.]